MRIGLRGLTGGGSSSASLIAPPEDPNRLLLPTAYDLRVTQASGQAFDEAEESIRRNHGERVRIDPNVN